MNKTSSVTRAGKLALTRKRSIAATQVPAQNDASSGAMSDAAARRAMIAEAAYFRAERRGFVSGFEVEDWLQAESELSTQVFTQIQRRRLEKSQTVSVELH